MWLEREIALIGEEAVNKLKNSHIIIFGIGGVGSYAAEALVRCGIGKLTFVDGDSIAVSNINRQLIADTTTVGQMKAEAALQRAKMINPECEAYAVNQFADSSNTYEILKNANADYILDCIDCVSTKLLIARWASENNVRLISSMGTGNKLDPSKLQITDIFKTSVCPLARVMRREIKNLGLKKLDVIFSTEEPIRVGERTPASISFVPSVAGLMMAGHAVRNIIKTEA